MKNIISILFIALFLFSCESQLDSLRPKGSIEQSTLKPEDVLKLRNGVYSEMEDVIWSVYFDFDIKGENFKAGPGFSLVDPVAMSPDQSNIQSMWSTLYFKLRHVNFLIETIEELDDTRNNTIKGEMYFFRSLIYYNLVTRWGGVPIMKKRTYEIVPRSTEQEVWNFILSDLQVAEANIGDYVDKWYASKPAVFALAARVYQAQKDNAKVIEYCNKIVVLNKFVQTTTPLEFSNMFVPSSSSRELIFSLVNNNPSNKHRIYPLINDVDASWEYSATTDLFSNLYSDYSVSTASLTGDKRKTAVFTSDVNRIIKYPNGRSGQQLAPPVTGMQDYCPLNVFRYSEILLMLAEAQGPGTVAATTLKPYFANRYSTPPTDSDIAGLSATDFQNLILTERRREFFGEGQWWYDIKRTNRKDLLPSLAGRDHLMYYPIPQNEKDLAGYQQNSGY